MMDTMADPHMNTLRGFRPDSDAYDEASELLEARGRTVGGFLQACVNWVRAEPDAALAAVAAHWPKRAGARGPEPGRVSQEQQWARLEARAKADGSCLVCLAESAWQSGRPKFTRHRAGNDQFHAGQLPEAEPGPEEMAPLDV